MSGFSAVRKAKKRFDQQQAAFEGMRARDMRLINDGDEAVLWFVGTESEEPREVEGHTLSLGGKKGFRWELCARGREDHEGCVYCYANKSGDRRVRRAVTNFMFSVADTRWVHKLKDEDASKKANRDVFEWSDCKKTDDNPNAPCNGCKKKIPRERGGKKKLRVGLTAAIAIDNLNSSLKKRCQNCNGKITITGYVNGKKHRDDIDDLDEEDQKKWEPQYECSKCDDPLPGSIYACPILMRRNGTGQTTTYAFEKHDDFQEPPDWVQEIEPFEWDKILVPRDAENMAKQLDIDNPFEKGAKTGKKRLKDSADDYDDDELDDDEDEDEDKEEPFEDDEDDEDDDEDDDDEE